MRNKQNYLFTKKLYWDLMIDCKKKGDEKNYEFLKNSWQEIEKMYADTPVDKKGLDTATE